MKSILPKRRLIPKWRPVEKSLQTTEVLPMLGHRVPAQKLDQEAFSLALHEWQIHQTAGHFGDLLSFSFFPECAPKIAEIARSCISKGFYLTPAQRTLSGIISDAEDKDSDSGFKLDAKINPFASRLHEHRRLLRENPSNSFLLLDFAQLQLAGGNLRAADRALRVAKALMPSNPLVLRTVARYLVHIGEAGKAHALIARHPACRKNPWLLASELALADAAGEDSKFFGYARKLVLADSLPDAHVTELAGALFSHQLVSGHTREARKFFIKATAAPNDNVAAQIVTDQRELNISLEPQRIQLAITSASEAHALAASLRGNVHDAASAGIQWLCEEPFSSRPVQFLSGVYTLDDDYDRALEIVNLGLRADPQESRLLVNLCYLHAALGNVEASIAAGKRALHYDRAMTAPFIRSTMGMISLMAGHVEEGDKLYQESMDEFERTQRWQNKATCAVFYARAAKLSAHPRAAELLLQAADLVQRHPSPDSVLLIGRLMDSTAIVNAPEGEMRRSEQYIYHSSTNILERVSGVTARGARAIIWSD